MNQKWLRRIIILSGVLLVILLYLIFYYKTYSIRLEDREVYELMIQSPPASGLGLDTKIITNPDEINTYLEQVNKLRFTHPRIDTGKGWVTRVDIKYISKSGHKRVISYTILGEKLRYGSFTYDIRTQ